MPSYNHIVCECSSVLIKSIDGAYKLRAKIILFKSNQAYAVCRDCNKEVKIPVYIDFQTLNPPLVIKR